jgi:hypothetical protein
MLVSSGEVPTSESRSSVVQDITGKENATTSNALGAKVFIVLIIVRQSFS